MWRAPTVRALALELSFLFPGESCSQEDRGWLPRTVFQGENCRTLPCTVPASLSSLHYIYGPSPTPRPTKGGWISVPPTSILTVVLCGGSFPSLASRVPFLLIPSQQLSGDRSPSPARQFSSGRMASMSQLPCLLGTGTAPECSSGLGTVQERAQESATSCVGFLTQSCWGSEGWLEWRVPRGFS